MNPTSKGKLLKAGVIYTIANIILKGVSFFTIPLFIRLLSPEEFGRFNVFISFEAVIFMFSGLTLHASIKNACYDLKDDYDTYVKNWMSRGQVCDTLAGGAWRHTMSSFLLLLCHNRSCLEKKMLNIYRQHYYVCFA